MESSFGRYELVRPLDRGGMGEVWLARARGPERVHKTVVLKRIRPDRAGHEAARHRFAEEARVAVSLSHPHIVPVFEFGQLDGDYFLVMEWLRGGSLSRVAGIDRAPLRWAATALVGVELCDALGHVHAQTSPNGAGLVHGDVTPRNVLFSPDGHALLADFGLARFAGLGRAGTVRYRAPEQARGEPFDARADLFALALILAEAATGQPAYDRDTARAERQVRVGMIPDLGGCDAGLARVLRRALAAQPVARFETAAAMGAAFEALLDREPGARTAARAELSRRCAQLAAAAAGEGSRDVTQVTRDATRMAHGIAPARLVAAVLGVAAVVAVAAWSGLAHRRGVPASVAPSGRGLAVGGGAALTVRAVTATAQHDSATHDSAAQDSAAQDSATHDSATHDSATHDSAAHDSPAQKPAPHERAHSPRARRPIAAPASLDVNAAPWAHVRVDGVPVGETPLLNLSLPAGEHTLELVNEPLGAHRQLVITVRSGEHFRHVEDLAR